LAFPEILSNGEQIILEEENGFRSKIVLTNMRLLYLDKQGFIKSTWRFCSEIPLLNIEKAYVTTGGFLTQINSACVKMKNGEEVDLEIQVGDGDVLGSFLAEDTGTDIALREKTKCDRWVNAINQQLNLNVKGKTELLEERVRELEAKLKSTSDNQTA
jgi:hypothetical protein